MSSPESDDREDMRPEYDMRGGIRGNYFDRYHDRVEFTGSVHLIESTAGTTSVGRITKVTSYGARYPGPRLERTTKSRDNPPEPMFDPPNTVAYAG